MSNPSLKERLRCLCGDYRRGRLSLTKLIEKVELHAAAFEKLPFLERKKLEYLAHDLYVQAGYAEEGCQYEAEVDKILEEIDEWLSRIPS